MLYIQYLIGGFIRAIKKIISGGHIWLQNLVFK